MRFAIKAVFLSILVFVTLPPGVSRCGIREDRPNMVSFGVGGQTVIGVVYDGFLTERFGLGVGAGYLVGLHMSWIPVGDTNSLYTSLGGYVYPYGNDDITYPVPTLTLAWQHVSASGFSLRLGVSLYWYLPVPYLAIGGSF